MMYTKNHVQAYSFYRVWNTLSKLTILNNSGKICGMRFNIKKAPAVAAGAFFICILHDSA